LCRLCPSTSTGRVPWYPTQAKIRLDQISCHALLERSACAPFIKERRMECINATSLHRKSGPWGTHLLLLVHRKFEVVTTRQLSHPLPVPAAKAGCPIQAVFWLEWDHSTRPVEVDGQSQHNGNQPGFVGRRSLQRPLIWTALAQRSISSEGVGNPYC
jgi:hypothetical protein